LESKKGDYFEMKKAVLEVVGKHFRPEFINRIDEMVVFHPLDEAQIKAIADIQIQRVRLRLAEKDFGFTVSNEALDYLALTGYDPVYGARPLKRAIQQHIENPLAQAILAGQFNPGDIIKVDLAHGKVIFSKGIAKE
jgi:ATP-dependent Clp protease ATP-binding subunit ClpB